MPHLQRIFSLFPLPALLCLLVVLLLGVSGRPALAQTGPWTVYETLPSINNGNSHVLWIKKGTTNSAGTYSGDTVSIWTVDVNGHEMAISPVYGPYTGWRAWELTPAFDGTLRMAWTQNSGTAASGFSSIVSLWTLDGSGNRQSISPVYGPYAGWEYYEEFANPDTTSNLYWVKPGTDTASGEQLSIWTVDSVGSRLSISPAYGPYPGWQFQGGLPSFNRDGTNFVVWVNAGTTDTSNNYTGDQLSIWKTDSRGTQTSMSPLYGRYPRWQFKELYPAYDGTARLLWIQPGTTDTSPSGFSGDIASIWSVDATGHQAAVSPAYGPYSGWTADSIVAAPSSTSRLLWITPGTTSASGSFTGDQASIWSLNAADVKTSISPTYTAPGGTLDTLTIQPNGSENLTWRFGSGAASNYDDTQFSLWDLDASNNRTVTGPVYGPYP